MGAPTGFSWVVRKGGDVVISHHGRTAATLRGRRASQFLAQVGGGDGQLVAARWTGNYRHGNERRGARGSNS